MSVEQFMSQCRPDLSLKVWLTKEKSMQSAWDNIPSLDWLFFTANCLPTNNRMIIVQGALKAIRDTPCLYDALWNETKQLLDFMQEYRSLSEDALKIAWELGWDIQKKSRLIPEGDDKSLEIALLNFEIVELLRYLDNQRVDIAMVGGNIEQTARVWVGDEISLSAIVRQVIPNPFTI